MPSSVTITAAPETRAVAHTSAVTRALAVLMDRFGRRSTVPEADDSPTAAFSRLEAEVLRLSRERAQAAAENELLGELIGRSAREGAERLLQRIIVDPTHGAAALIDLTSGSGRWLAVRGNLLEAATDIKVPQALLDRLGSESRNVRPARFQAGRGGELIVTLCSEDSTGNDLPPGLCQLIPICDGPHRVGLLITSHLWPTGVCAVEQFDTVTRFGQAILRRHAEECRLRQHQHQLWLANEKLRLKAVTDRATEEPLKTLGEFLAGLCEATQMERAVLYLVTRRAGDVPQPVVEAGAGVPPLIVETWRTQEVDLARSALQSTQGLVLKMDQIEARNLKATGLVCVWPLQSGGRRLGTMILCRRSPEPLDHDLQELLGWSANLLAQTLHRIYRDAAIRRQARHDGLTDLANRRTFDALIAVEVDRVRLGASEECSLLLADLDRFKSINDRFGHQAGDVVLRELAQLLREHLSRTRMGERCLLARYGGEELALLLPGMGTAGALRIAEEIRGAVENLVIEFGNRTLQVTVSIGAATCPLSGPGASELIAAADSALYRAKAEGRNRVCLSHDLPRSSDTPAQNASTSDAVTSITPKSSTTESN